MILKISIFLLITLTFHCIVFQRANDYKIIGNYIRQGKGQFNNKNPKSLSNYLSLTSKEECNFNLQIKNQQGNTTYYSRQLQPYYLYIELFNCQNKQKSVIIKIWFKDYLDYYNVNHQATFLLMQNGQQLYQYKEKVQLRKNNHFNDIIQNYHKIQLILQGQHIFCTDFVFTGTVEIFKVKILMNLLTLGIWALQLYFTKPCMPRQRISRSSFLFIIFSVFRPLVRQIIYLTVGQLLVYKVSFLIIQIILIGIACAAFLQINFKKSMFKIEQYFIVCFIILIINLLLKQFLDESVWIDITLIFAIFVFQLIKNFMQKPIQLNNMNIFAIFVIPIAQPLFNQYYPYNISNNNVSIDNATFLFMFHLFMAILLIIQYQYLSIPPDNYKYKYVDNKMPHICSICLQYKNQIIEMTDTTQIMNSFIKVSFEKSNIVCRTWCGHYFHQQCLSKWIQKKKQCPICKREISKFQ